MLLSMSPDTAGSKRMPCVCKVGLDCTNRHHSYFIHKKTLSAAVQAGTSHDLGDNFARAFRTQFLNEAGDLVHPQQSSWGASTRLIGGIIMTHGALMLCASLWLRAGRHRTFVVVAVARGALTYCMRDCITLQLTLHLLHALTRLLSRVGSVINPNNWWRAPCDNCNDCPLPMPVLLFGMYFASLASPPNHLSVRIMSG